MSEGKYPVNWADSIKYSFHSNPGLKTVAGGKQEHALRIIFLRQKRLSFVVAKATVSLFLKGTSHNDKFQPTTSEWSVYKDTNDLNKVISSKNVCGHGFTSNPRHLIDSIKFDWCRKGLNGGNNVLIGSMSSLNPTKVLRHVADCKGITPTTISRMCSKDKPKKDNNALIVSCGPFFVAIDIHSLWVVVLSLRLIIFTYCELLSFLCGY